MAITQTVGKFQFMDGLGDYFSYDALEHLYEYYNELSQHGDIEYDPISIRSEWNEYNEIPDLIKDYPDVLDGVDPEDEDDDDRLTEAVADVLSSCTYVYKLPYGLLFMDF